MQFSHYGQAILNGNFAKYDYGLLQNYKIYGQKTPPDYKIENLNIPVALHYGNNDILTPPIDVLRLKDHLPNIIGFFKVPQKTFNHYDFMFGNKARKLVYSKIKNILAQYS